MLDRKHLGNLGCYEITKLKNNKNTGGRIITTQRPRKIFL